MRLPKTFTIILIAKNVYTDLYKHLNYKYMYICISIYMGEISYKA